MEAEQAGRWEQVLACRAISWNTPMSDEMYFVIFYFLSLLPPTLEPCCGITRGRLWHYMRHVVGMTWVLWRISHWSCHDCLSTLTVHTGVGMYSAIVGACLALSSLEVRRYTWERGSGLNGRKRRKKRAERKEGSATINGRVKKHVIIRMTTKAGCAHGGCMMVLTQLCGVHYNAHVVTTQCM